MFINNVPFRSYAVAPTLTSMPSIPLNTGTAQYRKIVVPAGNTAIVDRPITQDIAKIVIEMDVRELCD